MKVALLTNEFPPYPGGVARYCTELVSASSLIGVQTSILAPSYRSAFPDEAGKVSSAVTRFDGGLFKLSPIVLFRLVRSVQAFLRKQDFDVVHAADWPMIMALNFVNTGESKRFATLHGTDINILKYGLKAKMHRSLSAIKNFDRYIANSEFTADLLQSEFPKIDKAKIYVAPLGVNESWFDTPDATQINAAYQKYKIERNKFTIVTVARIEPRKGHEQFANALALLPPDLKDQAQYITLGRIVDQKHYNGVSHVLRDSGVKHLHLQGVGDGEMKAIMAGAQLFALPALDTDRVVEGFGLVLLEAAALGLPSLVTRVHAIPEVVVDNKTGWIVEKGNAGAIASKLADIIMRKFQLTDMKEACIDQARVYSWKRCAQQSYL